MRTSLLSLPLALLTLVACVAPDSGGHLSVADISQLEVTITVPGDYGTINGALAYATMGDVIQVAAGTYNEDLTLRNSVWLVGAGMGQTVLQGKVEVTTGAGGLAWMSIVGPGMESSTECGVQTRGGATTGLIGVRISDWRYGACFDTGEAPMMVPPWIEGSTFVYNGWGAVLNAGEAEITNTVFAYHARSAIWVEDDFNQASIINNTFLSSDVYGLPEERDAAVSLGTGGAASIVRNNSFTSNSVALHCDGCLATADHNHYWDNVTDYGGDAVARATDVHADPEYISLDSGNLRLEPNSPLIDAGSLSGAPAEDLDGDSRPFGAGVDIGADEATWPTTVVVTLVISEVMANPLVESTGEFVELVNLGSVDVELAGLVLDDGDKTDVLEAWSDGTTVLPAGGIAVILDPGYAGQYAIPASAVLVTVGNATLGNGLSTSDPVTVSDGSGVLSAWTTPFNPGNGTSVERVDLLAGDIADNWAASTCASGSSPGQQICGEEPPRPDDASVLVITEVMANPLVERTGEFIEIWNSGVVDVDLAGLVIADENVNTGSTSADTLVSWGGGDTVLAGGARALILDPGYDSQYPLPVGLVLVTTGDATIGNGLSNANDAVVLYDIDGETVIDTFSFPADLGNGVSHEKIDVLGGDIAGNWAASTCGSSPGLENCSAPAVEASTLWISEVMANPLDEATGEFVEVFNHGAAPVELAGLVLDDGDKWDVVEAFGEGTTVVLPGEYAVIVDRGYVGQYELDAGITVVTVDDGALGSGLAASSDPITLFEEDGTSVIDSYSFPFNPGNGVSVERAVLSAGDVDGNWVASSCGHSAGLSSCGE